MKRSGVSLILAAVLFCGILFVGNGKAQRAPATALPDLTVSMGKHSISGNFEIGQMINIKPTVTNNGLTTVSLYSIVVYFSNHSLMTPSDIPSKLVPGSREVDTVEVTTPLAPGASTQVSIKVFRIPENISWGNYFITAIVDPSSKIAESDENNNRAQIGLFVRAKLDFIEQECWDGGYQIGAHGQGFGPWKNTFVVRVGPYTFPTEQNRWKDTEVHVSPQPGLIPVGIQVYDWGVYDGTKAICRIEKNRWWVCFYEASPSEGPPGTSVQIKCCECQSQGTKKLNLYSVQSQFVAEVPVTSWSNGMIVGTIPDVPPGQYRLRVTDGGQSITFGSGEHFKVI